MGEVIMCLGFQAAGIAAGIKKPGILDLGLIYSEIPANVAGVFTRNLVKAAPVLLSKQRLAAGKAQAVIANAGNANCCAGPQGMADAKTMTADIAAHLNLSADQVLVASTGVIGQPLPIETIRAAVPRLVADLHTQGFDRLARSIMTTDTVPKLIQRKGSLGGKEFSIVAVAKGAGMIRPDLATMLCFICTDASVADNRLQAMLTHSVAHTFNRLTIDGDTSTNDTVLILANGASGVRVETSEQQRVFQTLLDDLLADLSLRLVRDGEGVTKVVHLTVQGAASDQEALQIADTVAHSPLVKTAFFGEDANWGRILGAAGRAGVCLDPDRLELFFDDIRMVAGGMGCGRRAEEQVTAVMKKSEFRVLLDLHLGEGRASMLTCDFSVDYVKINADYRT